MTMTISIRMMPTHTQHHARIQTNMQEHKQGKPALFLLLHRENKFSIHLVLLVPVFDFTLKGTCKQSIQQDKMRVGARNAATCFLPAVAPVLTAIFSSYSAEIPAYGGMVRCNTATVGL